MKDWSAVFAVALVIIVGSAAGLAGTVIFLLAFLIGWYLLTAREIGFASARDKLQLTLSPPLMQRDNWRGLNVLFADGTMLLKAATVALIVTGAALVVGAETALAIAALVSLLSVSDTWRNRKPQPLRLARMPDATSLAPPRQSAPTPLAQPKPIVATTPLPPIAISAAAPPAAVSPPVSPAVAPPAIVRPAAVHPPMLYKPMPLRLRRQMQRALASAAVIGKRPLRKRAKAPVRAVAALPSRKPTTPAAIKSRKPIRQKPALRRPSMRKPLPLLVRGAARPSRTLKR